MTSRGPEIARIARALVILGLWTTATTGCGASGAGALTHRVSASQWADGELGLTLDGLSSYEIEISGCASGYRAILSELVTSVALYDGDRDCLGQLLNFSVNGLQYTPEPGFVFSTYQPGDVGVFGSPGADSVVATVTSQIGSPAGPGDRINYRLDQEPSHPSGSIGLLGLTVSGAGLVTPVTTHPPAPAFTLVEAAIIGEDPADQTLRFEFSLQCKSPLSTPRAATVPRCEGVPLDKINYLLIEDQHDGAPCRRFDLRPCRRIFRKGSTFIDPATDVLLAGDPTAPNGGFRTKQDPAQALAGPTDIAANPRMILVLTVGDRGNAFQYFDLTAGVRTD